MITYPCCDKVKPCQWKGALVPGKLNRMAYGTELLSVLLILCDVTVKGFHRSSVAFHQNGKCWALLAWTSILTNSHVAGDSRRQTFMWTVHGNVMPCQMSWAQRLCEKIWTHDDDMTWNHVLHYWPFVGENPLVAGRFLSHRASKSRFNFYFVMCHNRPISQIEMCTFLFSVHISVLNGALWVMQQVNSGIWELGQLPQSRCHPWRPLQHNSRPHRPSCSCAFRWHIQVMDSSSHTGLSGFSTSATSWIIKQIQHNLFMIRSWWRHQMENIFRVTGHLCGEFTGPRWIPRTKASDAGFDVFFDLSLNKRLGKQSWGWWFETLSCP